MGVVKALDSMDARAKGEAPVRTNARSRPDLWLFLSLMLAILLQSFLDHGDVRRLILAGLMFVPSILSIVRLAQIKGWVWQSMVLPSVCLIS